MEQFAACWEGLEDPRTGNAALHDLHGLLMIALCSVLCGGQKATEMTEFARAKEAFLRGFLKLAHGLPSHDTFSRLFRLLDPEKFGASFQRFMAAFGKRGKPRASSVVAALVVTSGHATVVEFRHSGRLSAAMLHLRARGFAPITAFGAQTRGVVAIDGKVVRRFHDKARGKSALHMVSAWGCEQRMVLAQIATDAKSNEITAIPKLLDMLALKGTIITTDALNCQRTIARKIVAQGGDYALALKENQPSLHADGRLFLDDSTHKPDDRHRSVDADHGRIETRTASVSTDIAWLSAHQWPGLRAIGKVVRSRETGAKTTTETAYYVLSTPLSAKRFNQVVRSHWGIENRLHWRLDVVMNEDQARNRADNGPYNLAVLRHMALNVMQKDATKGALRGKFKRAGWNEDYLTSLLALF